ncbi:MAG: hypothetical protein IJS94_06860, partial [Clostridia bacterium]|nr:hypothetical protein [Clostridia bacterium]
MAGIVFSKASNLNDSIFGKSQEPILMTIETKAEAWEEKSQLKNIFMTEKSENFAEKITSLTSMDEFLPVGEGGAYPHADMQEGYSKVIEPETWKSEFVITREMIDDSKLIDLKQKPKAFTDSYYRTRERFGAKILSGAISGSDVTVNGKSFSVTGADGLSYFHTAHTSKTGGATQCNKFSNLFTKSNFSKIVEKMSLFKDDNGNILNIAPDTIIIPYNAALIDSVIEVVGSEKDPSSSNNAFNRHYGMWNIIIWPYLNQFITFGASNMPFIIMDSSYNQQNGGGVWIDRVPLEVRSTYDETNDN